MSARRRLSTAAALVAATLIALPAPEAVPDAPQAVAQEAVEAPPAPIFQPPVKDTVDIEVATPDAWGSGTVIAHRPSGEAIVLTARHVLGQTPEEIASVETWIGLSNDDAVRVVDRACSVPELDICVLRAGVWRSIEAGMPELAGDVEYVTMDGRRSGELWGGILQADLTIPLADKDGDLAEWQSAAYTSLLSDHGDSGAGLFSEDGRLVGVNVGFHWNEEGETIAGIAVMGDRFVDEVCRLRGEIERRARIAEIVSRLTEPRL